MFYYSDCLGVLVLTKEDCVPPGCPNVYRTIVQPATTDWNS